MMDKVIGDLNLEAGRNYIDDVIIGSNMFEQHLADLKQVFKKLKQTELYLKLMNAISLKTKSNFWNMN